MIMKEEINNILNILFVGGLLLTIIFVVGGLTLDEVERGDYTMLVIIILVLIGGWSGFWEDPKSPREKD